MNIGGTVWKAIIEVIRHTKVSIIFGMFYMDIVIFGEDCNEAMGEMEMKTLK